MNNDPPKRSCFLTVFGGVFALFGGAIFAFGVYDYSETIETYRWPTVPAKVRSISVDYPRKAPTGSANNPFELLVDYEYEVDGKPYSGERFQRKSYKSGSYENLADLRWRLIKDEVSHAYVNAKDPTESILKRESLGPGLLLIVFPLPFLLIGLGLVFGGLGFRPGLSNKPSGDRESHRKSSAFTRASLGNRDNSAGCFMRVFGAVFMLVGLGAGYGLIYRPIAKAHDAANWVETLCTVVWSRVEIHDGEDNDTYSADVFYEYGYYGETHRSNAYSFMGNTSSSNRSAAREICRTYSAGKKAKCFVDPDIPWHAVIVRDVSQIGLWPLLPTIFFLVGALVFFASWKIKTAKR